MLCITWYYWLQELGMSQNVWVNQGLLNSSVREKSIFHLASAFLLFFPFDVLATVSVCTCVPDHSHRMSPHATSWREMEKVSESVGARRSSLTRNPAAGTPPPRWCHSSRHRTHCPTDHSGTPPRAPPSCSRQLPASPGDLRGAQQKGRDGYTVNYITFITNSMKSVIEMARNYLSIHVVSSKILNGEMSYTGHFIAYDDHDLKSQKRSVYRYSQQSICQTKLNPTE